MSSTITLIDFDETPWLEAAKMLATADEPERALKLLDLLPGYYRDNTPISIKNLRKQIIASFFQVQDYMKVEGDLPKAPEQVDAWFEMVLRGKVVLRAVREANEKDQIPHIVDYGPGDYMLPLGLKNKGLRFTYHPILLQEEAMRIVQPQLQEFLKPNQDPLQPTFFVAYEIIEHLHNPQDIATWCHRLDIEPLKIFLSTPKYTFNRGNLNWQKERQPHYRTYTPNEFLITARALFPEYAFSFYDDPVMVLEGNKWPVEMS